MFSNKSLSLLVSLETSAQALNFVSAPHASRPVCFWRSRKTSFSSSQIRAGGYVRGGYRGERPVAPNWSHLSRWNATFFKKEAIQRPFAAKVTRKHLDSHRHLSQTWLELPGLSHFLSMWLILRVAGSTCFNICLMTKVTLESWETWAAEQASKPVVGETKITCPL